MYTCSLGSSSSSTRYRVYIVDTTTLPHSTTTSCLVLLRTWGACIHRLEVPSLIH
jgi:hypothetical protein